jgi:hypothetical protein
VALLVVSALVLAGCADAVPGTAAPVPPIPESARQPVTLGEKGFTQFDPPSIGTEISYGFTLTNPNRSTWTATNITVDITYRDASGAEVGSTFDVVPALAPGATIGYGSTVVAQEGTTADLDFTVRATDSVADDAIVVGSVSSGKPTVKVNPADEQIAESFETVCPLHSSLPVESGNLEMSYLYRDEKHAIIGGEHADADADNNGMNVPARGALEPPVLLFPVPPDAVPDVECFANVMPPKR